MVIFIIIQALSYSNRKLYGALERLIKFLQFSGKLTLICYAMSYTRVNCDVYNQDKRNGKASHCPKCQYGIQSQVSIWNWDEDRDWGWTSIALSGQTPVHEKTNTTTSHGIWIRGIKASHICYNNLRRFSSRKRFTDAGAPTMHVTPHRLQVLAILVTCLTHRSYVS